MALPSEMVSSSEEISPDLPLSGTTKHHLRKAFNSLKIHASTVANFTLQWQDLEDHFVFINDSIQTELKKLQRQLHSEDTLLSADLESQANSQENCFTPTLKSNPKVRGSRCCSEHEAPVKSNETELEFTPSIESLGTTVEPHLNSSCEPEAKSEETHLSPEEECLPGEADANQVFTEEGKALLVYLIEYAKEHKVIREKICNDLKASPKPAKLIIEAIKWFYPMKGNDGNMDYDLNDIRRSCVILFEEMIKAKPLIEPQEKDEAKELFLTWMAKLRVSVENSLQVLGLLLLAAAFGLKDSFDGDQILNLFDGIVQRRKAPEYFRSLGLEDRASELVEKLISQKKRIEALRFIYEFGLIDKFPPVPILKDHVMDAKTCSDEAQNSLQSKDVALRKEMTALSHVIQCIEKYKLGSQFPPNDLKDKLEQLKKRVKRRTGENIDTTAPSPKDQRKQQNGNKRAAFSAESKWNKQKRHRATWLNQVSAHHLMQPPHHIGLYPGHDAPYFPSPMNSMSLVSRYGSVGTASPSHAIQPSHSQPVSSFPDHGVQFSSGASGRYGSFGLVSSSSHATQNMSVAARPYSLNGGQQSSDYNDDRTASFGSGYEPRSQGHPSVYQL